MTSEQNTDNPMIDQYRLMVPQDHQNTRLASGWIFLAVGSMAIAGILTILIVSSRVPYIQDIIPWVGFFHTALVVHVDLTVLTWFLAYAGMFWTLNAVNRAHSMGWLALILAVIGTLVMVASPFREAGAPSMNNYVPVLMDPVFLTGLFIFGLGFSVLVLRGLFFSVPVGVVVSADGAIRFALYTALVSALVAILALIASYMGMPDYASGQTFYEFLFWGSGHTLQFVHVQLVLVSWLVLSVSAGITPKLQPRLMVFFFALGLLPVLLTVVVYMMFDVGSGNHMQAITWLMQYGGGMAALPVGIFIVYSIFSADRATLIASGERNALFFSLILFAYGGILGFMISGSNVVVPAHYHGSIIAITIAFMGVTYHLLPRLGFRKPQGRMVNWQPVVLGIGQLMHITGLALSGGYGVQRKTAGAAQGLDVIEKKISMGIMGMGGLIAVIGGIMFMVIVYQSTKPEKHS